MINLQIQPHSRVFAGNPVRFKGSSDNFSDSAGVKAQLIIYLAAGIAGGVGNGFYFECMNETFDYIAVASQSDFNKNDTYHHFTADVTDITCNLKDNYILAENYTIEYKEVDVNGSTVFANVLTAKEYGDEYTFTDEATNCGIEFENTANVDISIRENFAILCSIFQDVETSIEKVADLKINSNEFDVSIDRIIRSLFDYEFDFEPNSVMTVRDDMRVKFEVLFNELYGNPITENNPKKLRFTALKGGINQKLIDDNSPDSFFQKLPTNKQFLTWCNRTKTTDTEAIERLYFFNHTGATKSLKLRVDIVFDDDSTAKLYTDAISVEANELVEICAGFADVILGDFQEQVTSYSIRVCDASLNVYSETFTYVLDYNFYPNKKFFVFQNSFGCYDSFRFLGASQQNRDVEREYLYTIQGQKNTRGLVNDKFTANSGWITIEEKDFLLEMILSEEIYEIKDSSVYRVVPETTKVFRNKTNEFLYELTVEYRSWLTEEHFSRDLSTTIEAIDDEPVFEVVSFTLRESAPYYLDTLIHFDLELENTGATGSKDVSYRFWDGQSLVYGPLTNTITLDANETGTDTITENIWDETTYTVKAYIDDAEVASVQFTTEVEPQPLPDLTLDSHYAGYGQNGQWYFCVCQATYTNNTVNPIVIAITAQLKDDQNNIIATAEYGITIQGNTTSTASASTDQFTNVPSNFTLYSSDDKGNSWNEVPVG